jgi:hypothetical protein
MGHRHKALEEYGRLQVLKPKLAGKLFAAILWSPGPVPWLSDWHFWRRMQK